MKLSHLKQIATYLQQFKAISSVHRVEDNTLKINFNRFNSVYFDMTRSNSYIYMAEDSARMKYYKAPFDIVLAKKLNRSSIKQVEVVGEDKLLRFEILQGSSYKKEKLFLQFEFTGRHTNIILLDASFCVIEALRHIDFSVSFRGVKVGETLLDLPAREFKSKEQEELTDVEHYLKEVFLEKEAKRLLELKKQKAAKLIKQRTKLQKVLDGVGEVETLLEKAELFQNYGNLVLANIYKLKPYDTQARLEDFEGKAICFDLPSQARSVSHMADIFFARSKKAKQKAKHSYLERESLGSKIAFINHFLIKLDKVKTQAEFGILSPKKEKGSKEEFHSNVETFYIEDTKVLMGKNEKGNIEVLKQARASDIWLHLKDRPSPHVIIVTSKAEPKEKVLEFAAGLCVDFSNVGDGDYEVDYTQRRNVRVQEGANVFYNPYKTIIMATD